MIPYAQGKRWTLYKGDCLEWLVAQPDDGFDGAFVDPPYSINTKSDGDGKLSPWADYCNAALWYTTWIREARRVLRPHGALWACLNWRSQIPFQKAACDARWAIESMLIWDKDWIGPGGVSGLRPSYEMVALWLRESARVADRGLADVQTFPWSSQKPNGHPAEKPVDLARWCLSATVPPGNGRRVLDLFVGSGTAGVAALALDFEFVGVELDEAWCERAARRLGQAESDGVQVGLGLTGAA